MLKGLYIKIILSRYRDYSVKCALSLDFLEWGGSWNYLDRRHVTLERNIPPFHSRLVLALSCLIKSAHYIEDNSNWNQNQIPMSHLHAECRWFYMNRMPECSSGGDGNSRYLSITFLLVSQQNARLYHNISVTTLRRPVGNPWLTTCSETWPWRRLRAAPSASARLVWKTRPPLERDR